MIEIRVLLYIKWKYRLTTGISHYYHIFICVIMAFSNVVSHQLRGIMELLALQST